jgi:hypothetical protein
MERGSSKHSPRLDEEMAREVRGIVQGTEGGRIEEWREPEAPGEDQPEAAEVLDGGQLTETRLGQYLDLSALPGDRDTLRRTAEKYHAPDDVLDALDRLPADRTYRTVSEVWAALG